MNISSVPLVAVTALAAGTAGYWLRQPAMPVAIADVQRQSQAASGSMPSVGAVPLIAVAGDGTVTLRVEQQPLEWVLEQIALQSGWEDVKTRASATPGSAPWSSSTEATCSEPARAARVDASTLLQQIQRGSEEQRARGLLEARSANIVVPDEILKSMFETDASDRVRLFAFESYLETRADNDAALRRALEAALLVPNAAIQREAKARLDELAESERIDTASKKTPDS